MHNLCHPDCFESEWQSRFLNPIRERICERRGEAHRLRHLLRHPGDKNVKLKRAWLNLVVRNNRFRDRLSHPRKLNGLEPTKTFLGVTFKNMTFFLPLTTKLSAIMGSAEAPDIGEVMFKNITFRNGMEKSGPVKLTRNDFKDYLERNEFVEESIFAGLLP